MGHELCHFCSCSSNDNSLQWRHYERDGVSNHRRLDCLPNRLFRRRSKKTSKSLAFVRGIHRWAVNFPHKRPVTRKMFPFDDIFVYLLFTMKVIGRQHTQLCLHYGHAVFFKGSHSLSRNSLNIGENGYENLLCVPLGKLSLSDIHRNPRNNWQPCRISLTSWVMSFQNDWQFHPRSLSLVKSDISKRQMDYAVKLMTNTVISRFYTVHSPMTDDRFF